MLRTLTLVAVVWGSRLLATSFSYSTIPTPGFGYEHAQAPASGINDQGTVVGSYLIGLEFATGGGFIYKDSQLSTLDLLPYAITLTGINNSDQIIGYYELANSTYATFLYQNGTYTYFNYPGSAPGETRFFAINNDETILGTYVNGNQYGSFVLNNGTYTLLPSDAGFAGLNDSGVLVGSYAPDEYSSEAAVFINGQMQILHPPVNGPYISATAINDRGDIVGTGDTGGSETSFFLHDGQYSILDFPGALYTAATGINNKDQITGWYVLKSAQAFEVQSFIAAPAPEPATILLLAPILVAGCAFEHRRREALRRVS